MKYANTRKCAHRFDYERAALYKLPAVITLAASLLAIALFTGCPNAAGSKVSALTLTPAQQVEYDAAMQSLAEAVEDEELPAPAVAVGLNATNAALAVHGFKIVDTNPSAPVAKGTTKEQLKQRFIPAAL